MGHTSCGGAVEETSVGVSSSVLGGGTVLSPKQDSKILVLFSETSLFGNCWSSSILEKPSACSTMAAIWLKFPLRFASSCPIFKIFSNVPKAIEIILTSSTERDWHNGGMHRCSTKNLISSGPPLEVAFAMVQTASFLTVQSSSFVMSWMIGGMMLFSKSARSCSLFPPAMLEMAKHALFRVAFSGLERKAKRQGRAPESTTAWVCWSLPLAMLLMARRAGARTAGAGSDDNTLTKCGHTPVSRTA
mmetsp:Transcript_15616/g.35815  ORF Transcript_15616/g.35815 Transcript_15616/m.35815 type:complete len:246 (-) Transcript_15616:384-1121(-)